MIAFLPSFCLDVITYYFQGILIAIMMQLRYGFHTAISYK